ncbi:Unknown protein [Striga hermonthica]|uniref:NAC domain-containing protein n=1 Tax=Striga hermonthica TaxID=68872 RepID=A0A9N7NA84_STRHE|nr:Unknown protein [Striga hermonthica]
MAAFGFQFEPTDLEIIVFLVKRVTGYAGDDDSIKTDNLYGHREPWEIFGDDDHTTRRYFYSSLTKKTAGGHRFSRNVGKGTWTNKGQATPVLSVDRRVIIGYRRTFRYQTKAMSNSDKGSWLMTEYVLPDTAIKSNDIKEEYKNFALCVLKKKTKKIVKPRVGSGLGDFGVEGSCSCGVVASLSDCGDQTSLCAPLPQPGDHDKRLRVESEFVDFGDVGYSSTCGIGVMPRPGDDVDFGCVGPEEVQADEDWIHELEESIMEDQHDDVMKDAAAECPDREEGDSSPGGAFPLADDVVFGEVGTKVQTSNDDDDDLM